VTLLWDFLAGAILFNSIPHLVKGITGQTHMTPFKRVSSPLLNVIWAFVNILLGIWALRLASGGPEIAPFGATNLVGMNLFAFLAGGFVTAAWLAIFWSDPAARLPWHSD
jgi:hypothetical protein